MAEETRPGYWAVIPAEVRYDTELPASAKLLYAEISALADREGFCWAQNQYFAQLYGMSEDNVRRLIKALTSRGYIRVELEYLEGTGAIKQRKLYVGVKPQEVVQTPTRKNSGTSPKKSPEGSPKKCPAHNKEEQSSSSNNTPYSPPRGTAVPKYKPEWFEAFWKVYPLHASRPKAIRAWDNLKPDRALCAEMSKALAAQKQSPRWWDSATEKYRKEYIPYPSTWLNQRQWENDVITSASPGTPPDGPSGPSRSGQVEERGLKLWN